RYLFSGRQDRRAKYSRLLSGGPNIIQGESIAIVFPIIRLDKSRDGSRLVLRKNLLKFLGHGLNGRFAAFHSAGLPDNDVVFLLPDGVEIRMIDTAVGSAALGVVQRSESDRVRHDDPGFQAVLEQPARVVEKRTFDSE